MVGIERSVAFWYPVFVCITIALFVRLNPLFASAGVLSNVHLRFNLALRGVHRVRRAFLRICCFRNKDYSLRTQYILRANSLVYGEETFFNLSVVVS